MSLRPLHSSGCALLLCAVLCACPAPPGGGDGGQAACESTRDFFVTEVYGKVFEPKCNNCHVGEGTAKAGGARFLIFRDTHPDFITANIAAVRDFAKTEVDGKPTLLQKPLGQLGHGGGTVLAESSAEFKALAAFVNQVRAGGDVTCPGQEADYQVSLLDNEELLRKASIVLAGKLPPADVRAQVRSDDAALDRALLALTREDAFYEWLREAWNDALLTDGAGGVFDLGSQYPNNARYTNDMHPKYTPANRTWADLSVREEPTRFIEYVVRNELPFGEVLTGQYVVVNPYLAVSYGITDADPPDGSFWTWTKQTGVKQVRSMREVPVPSSGVLSTPAFLTRWETTPTNKGRKRAWKVLQLFLATDVLKFADRPVDSSQLTSVQNPTRNSETCRSCHAAGLDEIAGAFRGYAETGSRPSFNPDDTWHDDLFAPGFSGRLMPAAEYPRALQWMTQQLVSDPRFGIAVTRRMFEAITGLKPSEYPKNKEAPDYAEQVRAFTAQADFFHAAGQDFMEHGQDLRRVILAVVKSPFFRAKAATAEAAAMQANLGATLLTPETLSRKYTAVFGFHLGDVRNEARLQNAGYKRQYLREEWRLMLGGIDSRVTTKRATAVSPTMLAGATYLANVMACRAASFDFTRPAGERALFPLVEQTTVPLTPRASEGLPLVAVPENQAKIRQNLVELHWRFLGEKVEPNGPEVNASYALYEAAWKELEAEHLRRAATNGNNYDFEYYGCGGRTDYTQVKPTNDGFVDLGMDRRIDRDRNFTIRAWQAVLVYLATDFRFLNE